MSGYYNYVNTKWYIIGCLLYIDVVDFLMIIVVGFTFGEFELKIDTWMYYMHAYCYCIEYWHLRDSYMWCPGVTTKEPH